MSIKVTITLVFFTLHLYIGLTRSLLEYNAPILNYKIEVLLFCNGFVKKHLLNFQTLGKLH